MTEQKKETIFPKGIYFDRPREGAPEFVKGKININVDEAITFLQTYKNQRGYVNLDLKKSRDGKLYLQLNTFVADLRKPDSIRDADLVNESLADEFPNPEDIPF